MKPVAWRVADYAGGWIHYTDEEKALQSDEVWNGAKIEALYNVNPAPILEALMDAHARCGFADDRRRYGEIIAKAVQS